MAASIEQVNMTEGALLPKVLRFSLPLAATGVLQLLFNAADVIVVGKFAGATALAAVGATTALINLLVNAFMGISVGVNILVARYLGCRDRPEFAAGFGRDGRGADALDADAGAEENAQGRAAAVESLSSHLFSRHSRHHHV